MDSQWPRFEVFKQETAKQPHQNVGSVHAADAEMALLNARDVCGRRPNCHSIWVARADHILMRTHEELAATPVALCAAGAANLFFHVFAKTSQRRAMTFVTWQCEMQAPSALNALALARATLPAEYSVWWVVPDAAMTRTLLDAAPSWFEPAKDKLYRQQGFYGSGRIRSGS